MPTFPTCRQTIPICLNIFRPSHYLVLAYWVYFHPTSLKCYFYQALPELYNTEKPITFFRKWGTPAFRNLFVMIPVVCILLTGLVGVPVAVLSAWKFNVSIDWLQWRDGGMLGVALGVTIGMAFGMVGRVIGGIALSTITGIVYGTTIGTLGGVSLSVALGVSFPNIIDGALIVGTLFGVVGGMALPLDIEIGVAVSLTFATMAAMSFGAEIFMSQVLGKRVGALLVRGMMSGAFVFGAFRLMFYPLQWLLAVFSVGRETLHPLHWDELSVIPLPWTKWLLARKLGRDEQQGLWFLASVSRNHFRRAVAQAVLYRYLHNHKNPLNFLYHLLFNPVMNEYLLVPVTPQNWEQHISVRQVFLGELALRPVEATQHPRFHRAAWWLNLKKRRQTTLTQFAGMLYDLLDERIIENDDFTLKSYSPIYSGLTTYPNGQEIALSYEAISSFLSYRQLSELPAAVKIGEHLALSIFFHESIRPPVLMALTRLGRIGHEVAVYCSAANRQTQLAALARAAGELHEVNEYVITEVSVPEQYLLRRIVYQWEQFIIEAIGKLGKSDIIPESQTEFTFENPAQQQLPGIIERSSNE